MGSELTATLTDSDSNVDLSARGDVERVRWLWQDRQQRYMDAD